MPFATRRGHLVNRAAAATVAASTLALALPFIRGAQGVSADVGSVLAVGALVALGTHAGWLLGLLAVLVGLTLPAAEVAASHEIAVALGGALAIGALGRMFAQATPHLVSQGNRFSGVWLLALGVAAMAMPDGWVTAFDSEGHLFGVSAVAKDASTGLRTTLSFEGFVPHDSPATLFSAWFPYLSLIAAVGLMVPWSARSQRTWVWLGPVLPALCLFFAGLAGLAEQLLQEPIDLRPEDWTAAMNRAGGGHVFVELKGELSQAYLGSGSRPFIDAVRLVLGGLLAALSARSLVLEGAGGVPLTSRSQPWVLVAILGTAISTLFAQGGQQLVFGGTITLLVASLAAAQFGHVSKRAPYGALVLASAYIMFALAGRVSGWLGG